MQCNHCGSDRMKSFGVRHFGTRKVIKYECEDCGKDFIADYTPPKTHRSGNLVVTSAVDGFVTNKIFFEVLKRYCKSNDATLIVLPVNHGKPFNENRYEDFIKPYLYMEKLSLNGQTHIMGNIKLGATLESPLHSMNSFSKGKNVVFGHPQVQLKTIPRKLEKYPAIITTTGTISDPDYNENKTAQKAKFNHSHSALFIDGKDPGRMRHLNFDGRGFYDLNAYYGTDGKKNGNAVEAIITGDEHVMFYDDNILEATYGGTGMVQTMKPNFIIRHDVLDCYSISHHHKNNVFTRYAKYIGGIDSIEDELNLTLDFIRNTTPKFAKSIIVPSNHNSHLVRWLNEADSKQDMVNAKIYHYLMYLMLDRVTLVKNIPKYPDPFALWAEDQIDPKQMVFLTASEAFVIHGIDVNNHGDLGINGSRGTNVQHSNLPLKSIIGHSHTPGIEKGSYQVGTSSNLRLDYNKGLSSWAHCHCLIHKNGKRQLIFIRDGEWK